MDLCCDGTFRTSFRQKWFRNQAKRCIPMRGSVSMQWVYVYVSGRERQTRIIIDEREQYTYGYVRDIADCWYSLLFFLITMCLSLNSFRT